MTTAFAHAAHLDLRQAVIIQPFAAVLAVAGAAAFWVCLHTALTGSTAAARLGRAVTPGRVAWAFGFLGAAWIYKIFTWN